MSRLPLVLLALAAWPAAGRAQDPVYEVEIDQKSVVSAFREREGKRARYVSLQFKLVRTKDRSLDTSVSKERIVVLEDGKKVKELDIFQPSNQPLTVMLAMDVS